MTIWCETVVAIASVFAVALGLWPILNQRSERFARWVAWVAVFALPFAGVMVNPTSDTYEARRIRIGVSIFGILVAGLAAAYWRSERRCGGFSGYSRFIVLGILNPNLLNSPQVISPPAHGLLLRELLRLPVAILVAGLAVIIGRRMLSNSEHSWFVNYMMAVAIFLVFMQALGHGLVAIWQMLGYRGKPFANKVWLSRTPAEFWRRWSPTGHMALYRYVYLPCGGRTHAIWATFMVFLVSGVAHEMFAAVGLLRVTGHQIVFFMLSCLGVMVSGKLERLSRWGLQGEAIMRLTTAVFMLAIGTLMFATFNNFVPMYHEPAWLDW